MSEKTLLDLPVELFYHIFRYCDAQTIRCKIRLVCKRLYGIVNNYDQIELEFKLKLNKSMNYKEIFRGIPPQAVSSLIISTKHEYISKYLIHLLIYKFLRFTEIRHLTFYNIRSNIVQLFFKDMHHRQLVSLTIESRDESDRDMCSHISYIIKNTNLQRLYLPKLNYRTNLISWPDQCQLMHLTMRNCGYNQYLAILQQLLCLNTFQLDYLLMDRNDIFNNCSSSQLTRLTIKDCQLSTEQLTLLVSNTPALRNLRLRFDRTSLDSYYSD